MKKILIFFLIIISVYILKARETDPSVVIEMELYGIDASYFNTTTYNTYQLLDRNDVICSGVYATKSAVIEAVTNNSNIDFLVYGLTDPDVNWTNPSEIYIKIVYNINDRNNPIYAYTYTTPLGINKTDHIPLTLTTPGFYSFNYEVWRRPSGGGPDIMLSNNTLRGRDLWLYYEPLVDVNAYNFNANNTSICTGSTVCFNTNYIPLIYYYIRCPLSHQNFDYIPVQIDYGDGEMSDENLSYVIYNNDDNIELITTFDPTSPQMCHTYTAPGVYTAKLLIDNGYINFVDYHLEIPLTITVSDNLTIDITNDNNCSDVASSLTALPNDFGPYTYNWSTGASTNNISTMTNGIYTVSVSSSTGCTGTANITLDKNMSCCAPISGISRFDGSIDIPYDLSTIPFSSISSLDDISLNGPFVMTSNTTIDSRSSITMGENVQITVPSGKTLTITNSHISACDKMWQGIVVEDGGTLIVTNSIIEDALEAIHVEGNGLIEVTNSIFDHNYIGIKMANCWSAPNTSIIEANTFKCTGGNTLRAPHIGERTMYGISLHRINGIDIGNQLEDISTSNKFISINNGILSNASKVNIYNNSFDDINDFSSTGFFPYSLQYGYAIKIMPSSLVDVIRANVMVKTNPTINYTLNKFTNCYKGIYSQGAELYALNNTMNNVQYGVLVQNTSNKSIKIETNQLSNVTYGITMNMNSASSSRIYNNQITVNDPALVTRFPINYSNSYGISISEASPMIRSYAHVVQNGISGGRNGIKLLNTGEGINVENNQVLMISSLAVAGVQNGIFAQNAKGTIIRENIIEGNGMLYTEAKWPPTNPYRKRGIALDRSRNILLGCNQASNIGYGLHFQANCETANKNITENTVSDCKYGWVLQKLYSHGYIGKEVGYNNTTDALLNNNNFMGTFNNPSGYRTYNFTDIGGGPFIPTVWHNTDPEPLYNGNSTSDPTISVKTSIIDPIPFYTYNTCTGGSGPWGEGLGIPDENNGDIKDIELINEEIYSNTDDAIAKWMEEKELYEKLKSNPDLLASNPAYQAFYTAKQDEVMAQMTEFEKRLTELTDTTILNDSLIYEMKKASTQSYNEAIISSEVHEMNLQKIQKIYLWLQDNEIENISQDDEYFLNEMYHACPYIAGKAVYVARAIYPLINNEDFVDDLELCNSQGVYKTSNESTVGNQIEDNISTNNIAFIKQNPVDATIQLIYSIKNANIIDATLLNLNGQLIQTFKLNTNENQLNIDSKKLSNGLYFLNIQADNNMINQLKVSILH